METKDKNIDNTRAEQIYPGAAIDHADDEKVTEEEVKERTCTLDNNPHSHGD